MSCIILFTLSGVEKQMYLLKTDCVDALSERETRPTAQDKCNLLLEARERCILEYKFLGEITRRGESAGARKVKEASERGERCGK